MEAVLIALWHKLKAALKHIEDELGFVPGEGGATAQDTGSTGPGPKNT